MVFDQDIREAITSTRKNSGLRAFTEKLAAAKVSKSDWILALQGRVIAYQQLTLESLRFLLRASLGTIKPDGGQLIPSKVLGIGQQIPDTVEPIIKAARLLGHWTSNVSLYETSVILRVSF